jgi:hypothetical protein
MTTTPDRQRYRALVADVAARAKTILPQETNGRIESAIKLVLMGDVQPQPDGTIVVGSSSDPSKTYLLAGHACDCQDFAHGKAPDGWCAHRIAAGIAKRVRELLPPPPSPPMETGPLPEAAASVNCHIMLEGRQVQITLRDTDENRLLQRLTTVLQRYPDVPSGNVKKVMKESGETSDTRQDGYCLIHEAEMRWNEGKDGRRGWYSHRLEDGTWCKGRARA